jgi:hypothetical protein
MSELSDKEGGYIGGVPSEIFNLNPGEYKCTLRSGVNVVITMSDSQVRIRGYDSQGRAIFFNVETEAFIRPDVLKLDV